MKISFSRIIILACFVLSPCFSNLSAITQPQEITKAIQILNSSLSDQQKYTLLAGLGVVITGEGTIVGATGVGIGLSLSAIKKWKTHHKNKLSNHPKKNKNKKNQKNKALTPKALPPRDNLEKTNPETSLSSLREVDLKEDETPNPLPPRDDPKETASQKVDSETPPPFPYREPEEPEQHSMTPTPPPLPPRDENPKSSTGQGFSLEDIQNTRENLKSTPTPAPTPPKETSPITTTMFNFKMLDQARENQKDMKKDEHITGPTSSKEKGKTPKKQPIVTRTQTPISRPSVENLRQNFEKNINSKGLHSKGLHS